MAWYRIQLKKGQTRMGILPELQEDFEEAFSLAQAPRQMALFGPGGKEVFHEEETCYLSIPRKYEVYVRGFAQNYGVVPCTKPPLERLGFLSGHYERGD